MKFKQRFFPEVGTTPKFYGYARVSHKKQVERGNSIADQEVRIRHYYEFKKLDITGLEWGGIYAEPKAQSAYTRPFPMRPAGKELTELLRPGDHVAVDKFDRMFRDLEDFANRRRWFAERGIILHIVNLDGASVDANSLAGDLYISFLCLLAARESAMISERVSLARSRRRAQGRHAGTANPPFFLEVVDCEPGKTLGGRLVFREWSEKAMEQVVYLRNEQKLSFVKIASLLKNNGVTPRLLPPGQIDQLYYFYQGWLKDGRPDVNTFIMSDYIARWKRELRDGKSF